ncbi:hypothetical protein J6590_033272 [Homalodisca vitripennis]|nr:hypothetical protein J6590_033272 [Homalodisca vitripennis]
MSIYLNRRFFGGHGLRKGYGRWRMGLFVTVRPGHPPGKESGSGPRREFHTTGWPPACCVSVCRPWSTVHWLSKDSSNWQGLRQLVLSDFVITLGRMWYTVEIYVLTGLPTKPT